MYFKFNSLLLLGLIESLSIIDTMDLLNNIIGYDLTNKENQIACVFTKAESEKFHKDFQRTLLLINSMHVRVMVLLHNNFRSITQAAEIHLRSFDYLRFQLGVSVLSIFRDHHQPFFTCNGCLIDLTTFKEDFEEFIKHSNSGNLNLTSMLIKLIAYLQLDKNFFDYENVFEFSFSLREFDYIRDFELLDEKIQEYSVAAEIKKEFYY